MSIIVNDSYIPKPQDVPHGGTGKDSFTPFGLLIGGASGADAIVDAGTGTQGQIYAGNAWTDQNQIGAWQYITTVNASNQSTVEFIGLTTTYIAYKILIYCIVPVTSGTYLQARTSSDNGTTYDSGSNNYGFASIYANDTGTAALNGIGGSTYTSIQIAPSGIGGNMVNTTMGNLFEITLFDPGTSYINNGPFFEGFYNTVTASSGYVISGGGSRNAAQVNNAIQFFMNSGNINSGTFKLFGLAAA